MGHRTLSRRRGSGTRYKSPSFRYKGDVKHLVASGIVKDIVNCPGHSAPLAVVKHQQGEDLMIACEGLKVGDNVEINTQQPNKGCTMLLKEIPDGTLIYNLEKSPGDGGKFARAGGTFARVMGKTENGDVIVKMPSRKQVTFNGEARATIGTVAGGGRKDKPFLKAGKKRHAMRAKGRLYPRTSGVAMNARDHPFGCGRGRHIGKPKTVSRDAPPGRKVGQIAARRTGRKK